MKKLISMTDFVLEQDNIKNDFVDYKRKVLNYANFLKQPLELWIFVPCDQDGNVMKEPDQNDPKYDIWISNDEVDCNYGLYDENYFEYQQAKERCLFDGFEVRREFWGDNTFVDYIQVGRNRVHKLFRSNNGLAWYLTNEYDFRSIEDLTKYNLALTPNALKQIGL